MRADADGITQVGSGNVASGTIGNLFAMLPDLLNKPHRTLPHRSEDRLPHFHVARRSLTCNRTVRCGIVERDVVSNLL
jgi:hypothetical protein